MATQTTSAILNNAIAEAQDLLTQYVLGEDLIDDLTTAFGSSYDGDAAANLIEQWQTGDFGAFPDVEVLSSASINGANVAFSADTNTIYISEEYLLTNAANQNAVASLVLEEFGHFVDSKINSVDSAGDEGAIFSGLVKGESFTDGELQQLKLENDKAIVNIEGKEIAIEQQASINTLPKDFSLRGSGTDLHVGDFNGDGVDDFLRQEKGEFVKNDSKNTAQIFLADSDGNFSTDRRTTLPTNFSLKGNVTNLHVGDFNGDGVDDFIRQEKGKFVKNDNRNTAQLFLADSDGNFSTDRRTTLSPDFSLKGDRTTLYVGDFNGDGKDDFLRQEKGKSDNDDINTADIFFSNGDGFLGATDLSEDLNIKGDLTTLHVGDFNGDGKDDFLRHRKNESGPENKIFFSNGDGTFETLDIENVLSTSEKSSGGRSLTNIHIGDFNGDGVDDFIAQRTIISKTLTGRSLFGKSFNVTSSQTGRIHFLDSNKNISTGRFGVLDEAIPASHNQRVHKLKFSIGDFNGDGTDDILSQANDANKATIKFTQDFEITGGADNNILVGAGNDDTLRGEDGDDSLSGRDGSDLLDGGSGDDILDGESGDDILDGGSGDDTLDGGSGDDTLDGGNGFNVANYKGGLDEFTLFREQDGSLTVTDVQRDVNGNEGVDSLTNIDRLTFGDNSVVDFKFGDASNDSFEGSSNIDFMVGGLGKDTLQGEGGNDTLVGGENDDLLIGGEGSDILEGGEGNDIIDGGEKEEDFAIYRGNFDEFNIVFDKDTGIITVTDDYQENGDEGTDTLTNISQLSFGDQRFFGLDETSTVVAVAGVSKRGEKTTTSISGGDDTKASNFIIDIEGETGLTLDFNTQQLADFVNFIALPDQGIENLRLGANLGFDALGGALSEIPGIGGAFSTGIAMAQTLANYKFDLLQVEAQKDAAKEAVSTFDRLDFGDIVETVRDTVVIEDFQIGVDNLFLPSLTGADGGYSIVDRTLAGKPGVSIVAKQNGEESELVFIANRSSLSPDKFETQIKNILSSQQGSSTVLGIFNQTPQVAQISTSQKVPFTDATFAGDHIVGEGLGNSEAEGEGAGDHEIDGKFGDDLLQGNAGDDFLHGGFIGDEGRLDPETGERSLKDGIFEYQNDGFDTLQGGLGDDSLEGGSGNDVLDGGGFQVTLGDEFDIDPLTGLPKAQAIVLEDDGTDRLKGGSGNDTFIFNTLFTGRDIIEDFTAGEDQIRIDGNRFGVDAGKDEVTIGDFQFSDGILSFNSQAFAELENFNELQGVNLAFSQNQDTGIVTFGLAN